MNSVRSDAKVNETMVKNIVEQMDDRKKVRWAAYSPAHLAALGFLIFLIMLTERFKVSREIKIFCIVLIMLIIIIYITLGIIVFFWK